MEINLIKGDCLYELNRLNIDFNNIIFVSDPPFNIGYKYNTYKDNKNENEYYKWLVEIFGNNKHVIIHYPENLYKYSHFLGRTPDKIVSWVYNSMNPRQHRDIGFFGIKPDFSKVGQDFKNQNDKRIQKKISEGKKARLYDWWEIQQVKNTSREKTEHTCQTPIEVMKRIIGILPENYTIIDPFMGSGTTGVACKELNRDFIGIEIDEKYFNISNNRILK